MEFGEKRLGNWVVAKYDNEGLPFIRIKPVSGEFSWEYSNLDEIFPFIEAAMDNENTHNGFQTCLSIMGMFLHAKDPIFYDLYLKCLEVYADIAAKRNPTTQEEERQIIDEMKVEYEIAEELKNMDNKELE
jgi:hypothetical protein